MAEFKSQLSEFKKVQNELVGIQTEKTALVDQLRKAESNLDIQTQEKNNSQLLLNQLRREKEDLAAEAAELRTHIYQE